MKGLLPADFWKTRWGAFPNGPFRETKWECEICPDWKTCSTCWTSLWFYPDPQWAKKLLLASLRDDRWYVRGWSYQQTSAKLVVEANLAMRSQQSTSCCPTRQKGRDYLYVHSWNNCPATAICWVPLPWRHAVPRNATIYIYINVKINFLMVNTSFYLL